MIGACLSVFGHFRQTARKLYIYDMRWLIFNQNTYPSPQEIVIEIALSFAIVPPCEGFA